MLEWLLIVLTGFSAGIIGGLLGTGGCVLMLPALTFLFNYELPNAIGTTVAAVVITATSGAVGHLRMRNVDFETVKVMALAGTAGALLGSVVFSYVASKASILSAVVGLAFLYVSVRMIYEGLVKRASQVQPSGNVVPGSVSVKVAIGFVIGILTGILGLGGGYALVPPFIYLLKAPVKLAVGTSLPSFIGMALVSAGFKWYQGYVDILTALLLGAGTAVGAQLGARLVGKLPSWLIKIMFGIVFLYVSLKFILKPMGITI